MAVYSRSHYLGGDSAYNKARFTEVIGIFVKNTVLSRYIPYESKLVVDSLRLVAFSPPVFVAARITRAQLRLTLNEIRGPELANAWCVTCIQQLVSYIFHVTKSRRKITRQ